MNVNESNSKKQKWIGLNSDEVRDFYNHFGKKQDWQSFYEGPAIKELELYSEFQNAQAIFELGSGTGQFAEKLLRSVLSKDCTYKGIDISSTMVDLSRKRLKHWSERVKIDHKGLEGLAQEPPQFYDRFVSNYVFDLLSEEDIHLVVEQARRILKINGRICLVSLTNGNEGFSRLITYLWEKLFRFRAKWVGGCRPVKLIYYLDSEHWKLIHHGKVSSFGIPSEIVVAERIS
ncbi:hypothetical protein BHF71_07215 [Vulcanibacillus modesticaldus]|uniref:Methyltransferase domain-containing protein n=1 Tax=Vulcanibacillus modesticaldus TaxID=337097 RepID=A0A1D2YW39_9BACI|nr:class I SAM-dependent methyltransferase [Vulcanibacillus modesticaldus]OEF99893.1 hypothetical protein BHF71_07215 [Vulcanibacillus modesticaldus]